eukprot:2992612-Karenia_brevis.AAC.1
MVESRLDRCYTSLPPWALSLMSTQAHICGTPFDMRKSGISDHAPVSILLTKFSKQETNRT